MQIQQASKFTNDVNRFHFIEKPSKRYLIAFHKLHFFEIKLKKAHLPKPYEKHHPWSLGFLALISGKVELKRVAYPNSLYYKRLEKSEKFYRQKKIFEEIAVSVMNK